MTFKTEGIPCGSIAKGIETGGQWLLREESVISNSN